MPSAKQLDLCYAALHHERAGIPIKQIAEHFNVTPKTIERRILAAMRDDGATQAQLRAKQRSRINERYAK